MRISRLWLGALAASLFVSFWAYRVQAVDIIMPDRFFNLPESAGSAPGQGFTITGLARHDDGSFFAANDGRTRFKDGTSFKPELVHLSPDFSRRIGAIRLFAGSSVQGVAIINNRIWFAQPQLNLVGSVAMDGTDIRMEMKPGYAANGLAFDPKANTLFISCSRCKSVSSYSWDGKSLISTITYGDHTPDQLLATDGKLYFLEGDNDGAANLVQIDPKTLEVLSSVFLGGVPAPEGMVWENGKLLVASDGYFHGEGRNNVAEFRLPD